MLTNIKKRVTSRAILPGTCEKLLIGAIVNSSNEPIRHLFAWYEERHHCHQREHRRRQVHVPDEGLQPPLEADFEAADRLGAVVERVHENVV